MGRFGMALRTPAFVGIFESQKGFVTHLAVSTDHCQPASSCFSDWSIFF
jgi:hypothetical protein